MNESLKTFLFTNATTIVIAVCSIIFFIFGYILSIRADVNSTEFQVQALQQSNASLTPLIPTVARIGQLSQDTNDKVNILINEMTKK